MMLQQTINFDDNYDYIVNIRNKYLDLDFNSNLNELKIFFIKKY